MGAVFRFSLVCAFFWLLAGCTKCDPLVEACGRPSAGSGPGPGAGSGNLGGGGSALLVGKWRSRECVPNGFGQFQKNVVTFSADAMTEFKVETYGVAGCPGDPLGSVSLQHVPRYRLGGNATAPVGAMLIDFTDDGSGLTSYPFMQFNVVALDGAATLAFGNTAGGEGTTAATRPTTLATDRYDRQP